MTARRVSRMAAGLMCLACVVAGCGRRDRGGDTTTLKLAFVTNNAADFWTIARRGVEQADAELTDVKAEFRITADGSAAEHAVIQRVNTLRGR